MSKLSAATRRFIWLEAFKSCALDNAHDAAVFSDQAVEEFEQRFGDEVAVAEAESKEDAEKAEAAIRRMLGAQEPAPQVKQ